MAAPAQVVTNATAAAPAPAGSTESLEIRPAHGVVEISQPWVIAAWCLAVVIALVAAWLLWKRFRRVQSPVSPPVPPHVTARQRLNQALRLIHDPRAFCIEVSDALRHYLEQRFHFRAPERTTEEFLAELQSSPELALDQKDNLGAFLAQCDLVKFARHEPPESELRALHDAALRLIDETAYEEVPTPATTPLTPAAAAKS